MARESQQQEVYSISASANRDLTESRSAANQGFGGHGGQEGFDHFDIIPITCYGQRRSYITFRIDVSPSRQQKLHNLEIFC